MAYCGVFVLSLVSLGLFLSGVCRSEISKLEKKSKPEKTGKKLEGLDDGGIAKQGHTTSFDPYKHMKQVGSSSHA